MEKRFESFFACTDESGVSNLEKIRQNQKIIRRVASTDKSRSFEAAEGSAFHDGLVYEDGKLIGFGIHIFNEDVYPLQSFEIYLRSCGLTGELDLSGCEDLVFVDLYHNQIGAVGTKNLPAMRIFGVQDNALSELDPTQMPAVQGIDAGQNKLTGIDVSQNPELVELYVNNNRMTEIDLTHNQKLKYFYCHGNKMTRLDTTQNPLLRHLNAADNPMKEICSLAPQRETRLPLTVRAGEGGHVGLRFNPVYNAQWKETGEWQQTYYAYPEEGYSFIGWKDETGSIVNRDAAWVDTYGESRVLTAVFGKNVN